MDRAQTMTWLRIVGIVAATLALIFIPYYFRGDSTLHLFAKDASVPLGLIFVPPFARLIEPDSKPIPMAKWLFILGLMFLGQVAVDFQTGWLPVNRYAAAGFWIFSFALMFLCGFLILRRWKDR
jgi:hypothetical protein